MRVLALESSEYAGLFAEYLATNQEYDHNIYPSSVVEYYLAKRGIGLVNLDAVLQCIAWYGDLSTKKGKLQRACRR